MAGLQRNTHSSILVVIDVAFIVLGSFLFLNVLYIPTLDFWSSWLLSIAGVMLASLPYASMRRIGIGIALVGTYSILRFLELMPLPRLQYGVALLFILIGTVNLVRGAHGKAAQSTNTRTMSV